MENETAAIGEASRRTGLAPRTIRFYEDAGVIPSAGRTAAGHRVYSETDIRRLRLARGARAIGLPLREVRELVEFAFATSCADYGTKAAGIARRRIAEVDDAITELTHLRAELAALAASAESAAASSLGMRVEDCPHCLLMDRDPGAECCGDGAKGDAR